MASADDVYKYITLGDWKNLTNEVMTSFFLYGTPTPPQALNDRVKDPHRNVAVVIDAASFMSNGPGRYANPSQVPFVQMLFGPPAVLLSWVRKWGIETTRSWTVGELKALILREGGTLGDFFTHTLQQYRIDAGSLDYAQRTYIYNSEKFDLSDSTKIDFNTPSPVGGRIWRMCPLSRRTMILILRVVGKLLRQVTILF